MIFSKIHIFISLFAKDEAVTVWFLSTFEKTELHLFVKKVHEFLPEASINSSYPINLKIELVWDYTFLYRKIFLFFSSDFFFDPLGSIFKLSLTRLPKLNFFFLKHDNLNCRGRRDILDGGISLLVGMTPLPVLGASRICVLSDLELIYIDFT